MIMDDYDLQYNKNKPVKCKHCGWTGIMKQLRARRILSSFESWNQLAGRDGWHYDCPECEWLVIANYNKVS